jgi:ribose/xylose/arabinose/galactoside ABC-type transport system permease subunit
MAVTSKALARTAAATSSTTLYTVPNTSTTTVVTNVAVTNTAASSATFTITLDGIDLQSGSSIAAKTTAYFDVKQVLPANATPKTITGFASATTVNFHISGVEIA